MKPKKQTMTSASHSEFTLDALYAIAPSCFTEVKGADGQLTRKVDFDTLRELLGDDIADAHEETFGFQWVGKQEAKRTAAAPTHNTLRPVMADSVNWDTTENLYIEGDNLEVLKLLQRAYLGKVKMIYIDPPYNTGKDFVYNDDFAISREEMDKGMGNVDEEGNRLRKNLDSNPRYHSDWCSMIYSRLLVARTLLSNDGVIFISIDDHEVHHLRKICDEVFGASNFVGQIATINNMKGRSDDKFFATANEYLLVYAKVIAQASISGFNISEEEIEQDYNKRDEIGYYKLIGLRKTGNAWKREERPYMFYPIFLKDGVFSTISIKDQELLYDVRNQCFNDHNVANITNHYTSLGYEVFWPQTNEGEFGRWRWGIETFLEQKDYNIELNASQTICTKMRATIEDGSIRVKSAKSVWYKPEYDTGSSGLVLKRIMGATDIFDNPKSIVYIEDILKVSTSPDSLILDFFSGSATTAHAVMQLNAEDGGNRKYIMVQIPEPTPEGKEARKAGYNTICEIGKERIRRAGNKIKEEVGLMAKKLDTGFRVLRVDSSNMENVYFEPAQTTQENLFSESVKAKRSELDLLFGCMVDWGVELNYPLRKEKFDGKNLHIVNEGALVACFDKEINADVVTRIAELKPLRIIFREECFATDADKLNIYEKFKQLCGWSDDEVYKRIHVF